MQRRGKDIRGVDKAETPSRHHSVGTKKAPPARFVKAPSQVVHQDWEKSNPTLRGFIGAKPEDSKSYFPVRAVHTVDRGYVGE